MIRGRLGPYAHVNSAEEAFLGIVKWTIGMSSQAFSGGIHESNRTGNHGSEVHIIMI